jgi:hypothetical protein
MKICPQSLPANASQSKAAGSLLIVNQTQRSNLFCKGFKLCGFCRTNPNSNRLPVAYRASRERLPP